MDEAERIRREAEAYADDARRRADAFAEARIRRLRELSDRLIATAETVDRRFGEALAIREQLDELVVALGVAAERAAREVAAEQPPVVDVRVRDVRDVRGTSSPPPLP